MSVRVAASAGFCFGVDRAVGLVEQTVREGKRAVTLGPIIHNHHVVQHFAALGVREIASPGEVPGGSAVIIRSHGVSRAVYEALQARGLEIIDATCPFVSRIHRIVQEAEANVPFSNPAVSIIGSFISSVSASSFSLSDFTESFSVSTSPS